MFKVRPYFETIASSLKFKIHKEAFEADSIPAQAGKLCFIKLGSPELEESNGQFAIFSLEVSVQLFVAKGVNTLEVEEKTYQAAEQYLLLAMAQRALAEFKTIAVDGYSVAPIDDENDNVQLATINFKTRYGIDF